MSKLLIAIIIALTTAGCTATENKEVKEVETTVVEEVKDLSLQEEICDQVSEMYGTVCFDGCETYFLKVDKTAADYADKREPVRIAKELYDAIDALTDDEFYFMLSTSDHQNVSIFRTSDGVYYTNCFGETIQDVNTFIQ